MKTKELIKRLNRIDGIKARLKAKREAIYAYNYLSFYMLSIPVKATNWLDLSIASNTKLTGARKDEVEALIGAYLGTPIDERGDEKKYTVQVLKDDNAGFLNQNGGTGELTFGPSGSCVPWRAEFTQAEIEQLKQRDDLAIDWDRAVEQVGDTNDEK